MLSASDEGQVDDYSYYRSTYYGTWMCCSPVSGFHPGFEDEDSVIAFIRHERMAFPENEERNDIHPVRCQKQSV